MTSALLSASGVLEQAGYEVTREGIADERCAIFENDTVFGFLLAFTSAQEMLDHWRERADEIITKKQFQLRLAGTKAWNAYLLLLAEEDADDDQTSALSLIEEDLEATRKIARAGVASTSAAESALLSLLPLQSAPMLERVDMPLEISSRATDVPSAALNAFLSKADASLVLQMLGEAS